MDAVSEPAADEREALQAELDEARALIARLEARRAADVAEAVDCAEAPLLVEIEALQARLAASEAASRPPALSGSEDPERPRAVSPASLHAEIAAKSGLIARLEDDLARIRAGREPRSVEAQIEEAVDSRTAHLEREVEALRSQLEAHVSHAQALGIATGQRRVWVDRLDPGWLDFARERATRDGLPDGAELDRVIWDPEGFRAALIFVHDTFGREETREA